MKTFNWKSLAAGAAVFLTAGVGVYGDTLYSNSTTDTGNSLDLLNGQTLGDEIVLGFPSGIVTSFSFEIYSPDSLFTGDVSMEVYLLANDGVSFNGYPTPNTSLFDSGAFTLPTPQSFPENGGADVGTVSFDLSSTPITVPQDFTLAVQVTGLAGGDSVGMELFDPATVGANYGDYWLNNGGWGLYTNATPTAFGAQFVGTPTPEPSTLCLGAVGMALLLGMVVLRRQKCKV